MFVHLKKTSSLQEDLKGFGRFRCCEFQCFVGLKVESLDEINGSVHGDRENDRDDHVRDRADDHVNGLIPTTITPNTTTITSLQAMKAYPIDHLFGPLTLDLIRFIFFGLKIRAVNL